MYVCYIVVRSCNKCCHGRATVCSKFVVTGTDIAVNNMKEFCVVIEMQKWISFAQLISHKIFHTAVKIRSIKYYERMSIFLL